MSVYHFCPCNPSMKVMCSEKREDKGAEQAREEIDECKSTNRSVY